jgi:hypothetical protein
MTPLARRTAQNGSPKDLPEDFLHEHQVARGASMHPKHATWGHPVSQETHNGDTISPSRSLWGSIWSSVTLFHKIGQPLGHPFITSMIQGRWATRQ